VVDRFHLYLTVPASPSVEHFHKVVGIPEPVAEAFVKWWDQDLDDELRKVISPRRLEYMAKNYQRGLELSLFVASVDQGAVGQLGPPVGRAGHSAV